MSRLTRVEVLCEPELLHWVALLRDHSGSPDLTSVQRARAVAVAPVGRSC